MADKATASISASVGSDFAKKAIGGNLNYTPANAGDKWIYLETIVDSTTALLIQAAAEYSTRYGASDAAETVTATGDIVRWIALKHTGTTDGSTTTTANLHLNLSGGTVTGSAVGDIVLKPGECFFAKLGNTEIDDVNADSSSGSIQAQVFAICDDGGV